MRLRLTRRWLRLGSSVLLLVGLAACQSGGPSLSPPTFTRTADGFSITETARVGVGTRSDFDEANRAIEAGDLDRGIALLEEVIASAPEFAAAYINLAIAQQRNDDLEAAEATLLRALEVNRKHPVAHNELGIVYRRTGRFELARKSFEAALALQPQFHFARKNLAVLCDLYMGQSECALENYRLYLELNPQDEAAGIWIADLESRTGRKED